MGWQVCVPAHLRVHAAPEHSGQLEAPTIAAHAWLWPTWQSGAE